MQKNHLEIACFNIESAMIAQHAGANRIEFCAEMNVGGITPKLEDFMLLKSKIHIPIFIMIRPRGRNFIYSNDEFEQMKNDMLEFKNAGADGFVFGILTENNEVNFIQNKELVDIANPLPCTFHRAFDDTNNQMEALEILIECGFTTILTSGNAKNALEGLAVLKAVALKANHKICIMPGGGVRAHNIEILKENISTNWFHSSAVLQNETANMDEVFMLKSKLN
ncbi:MAG: copper homeostasis protein CutC [Bacteroidia bacterium]